MKRRTVLVLCIIALMSPPVYEANSEDNDVNGKSYKNWFAKDIKITPEKVTLHDLLDSPNGGNWLLYHGNYGANRFSSLDQINLNTADKLVPKWIYQIGKGGNNLRSSPIVYRGIMYVTGSDEIHALDAATGTWLWVWRAYEKNSDNINRGVAILGNDLFFSTSDCRLTALDRISGNVVWSRQYAKPSDGYFSTMAPLVAGGNIILGISNHNKNTRGFVVSFSGWDGSELWRFWTIPENIKVKGAPTWMTGSYDPDSNIIYWTTGVLAEGPRNIFNPNIYDNSIVALDPKNGKIIWHTKLSGNMPFDWDANEPLVLTSVVIEGKNKKVILQAHRNGLFYLIDRTNGKIIVSKPFIERLNWSESKGNICPSIWGATNWMSPSFGSLTKLLYVMVLEGCTNESNSFHLKAIEPLSGNIVWDYSTRGQNVAAPGVLSTGGGIVFSGEGSGHVVVLNAGDGRKLWDFNTGKPIFSSPVTYLANNRQFISIVAGSDVITFGLFN